jgi:SAM-dependent methyltransferase
MYTIDSRGSFVGPIDNHKTDSGLLKALCRLVLYDTTLVDFGCGDASYAKAIANTGLAVEAYDGNPKVSENTKGFASVLDLSNPFDLGKQFDIVMCLEVAEHIPKKYEKILIDNLVKHVGKSLIISWAVPGQGGKGHVNEQSNKYVLELFQSKNFSFDQTNTTYLRNHVEKWLYFKNTLFVFDKKQ